MAVPTQHSNFDQAVTVLDKAFRQLKQSVSNNDADLFQSTTLRDVEQAAIDIEAGQRQRKSMRNMARIKPFLTALEKYAKVIDVLCNGTDYLPWIWAPIKLMLQIASEFGNVIDTLLNAYSQIAVAMPDFSRIGTAFRDNPHVIEILAQIYEDILEFHRRAYKFLRRRSWHIFFDSLWKSFEGGRLNAIIKNISCHRDLLMREVVLTDLIDAKKSRDIAKEQLEEREKKKEYTHFHDSIAWLKIADEGQLDTLDGLMTTRKVGTCEWVVQNPAFLSWRDDAHGEPIIWLNGIPGAGKTVLCSYVISSLGEDNRITAPFYICNSYTGGKNLLNEILRSLAAQLLRANKDLAPHIFDNYANTGLAPSYAHLRNLLSDLLKIITTVRMCIDGLDEFPDSDQRKIIQELGLLSKASQGQFRILFSSREVALIERAMKGRPFISLKAEVASVSCDIAAYVHDQLALVREHFDDEFISRIERQVVNKANGMFLWVRLIIASIDHCHSRRELQEAVDELPDGLDQAYGRILERVLNDLGSKSQKAIRLLEWIACSFRILKLYEVEDGIVFDSPDSNLNEDSKQRAKILDLCKPLIQDGPNNSVEFVHYSAKEYILHKASGPFLKYYQAHYDIAFACILYMNSSLCFYDPERSENSHRLRVLRGLHGLHHYANEFWFQHLLQYAKSDERVENEVEIEECIEDLLEAWKGDAGTAGMALKLDDTTTKDNIESDIMALESYKNAHAMGQDLLTLRAFLAQEKYAHQEASELKTLELKHDPTYFSDISQHYQDIVQFFMSCNVDDLPTGGTPEMLDQFRAIYLDTAFICRYRNCPRFSDGFKTITGRDEHEMGHIKPLRCADPSCDFFERGFTSRTGLLKHNRKYHPKPEEIDPPSFESIKAPPPPVFIPPPPPPPPSPPPRVQTPPRLPIPPEKAQRPREEEPKKKRVSKAKRGLRVHQCPMCPKIFTRAEGLRRHQATHLDPTFFCNIPDCGRGFHREDLLVRHLARHENKARIASAQSSDDTADNVDLSEDEEGSVANPRVPSLQNILNFWDTPTL